MPTTTVHIVTYNSAATIEACLRSLLDQTEDFAVHVWDNASTDDTVAIVQRLGVALTVSPVNLGYAAAHNRLLDQTASDYVLTLNPDVTLQPGFLAALVAVMVDDPQAGSAAGCLLRVDALDAPSQVVDAAGLYVRRNRRQGLLAEGLPIDQRPKTITPIFGPDGATAFYRRLMLDDIRVNGEVFDENFFMHKEDVDICWRAQLRGWEALYVPDAIAQHVRHFRPGQREQVSAQMRCLGLRNRYLLMLKNELPAHFRRDFVFIALYDLAILAYVLLRERSSLTAYRDVWRLRWVMLDKRRVIQAGCRVDWEDMRTSFELNRT